MVVFGFMGFVVAGGGDGCWEMAKTIQGFSRGVSYVLRLFSGDYLYQTATACFRLEQAVRAAVMGFQSTTVYFRHNRSLL